LGYSEVIQLQALKKEGKPKPKFKSDVSTVSLSSISSNQSLSRSYCDVTSPSLASSGLELILADMREDRKVATQASNQVLQQVLASQAQQGQAMSFFMTEIMKQSSLMMEQSNAQTALLMAQNQQVLIAQANSQSASNKFMTLILEQFKTCDVNRGEKRNFESADDQHSIVDDSSTHV
jgi:hypothetical protein